MIGYFIATGDPEVSEFFQPFIWGEKGLGDIFKAELPESFSPEFDLLLVKYFVEGKFSPPIPEKPQISRFSKMEKSISVSFGVRLNDFHVKENSERAEYICRSTSLAIELTQKAITGKVKFDFTGFISYLNTQIFPQYLKKWQ